MEKLALQKVLSEANHRLQRVAGRCDYYERRLLAQGFDLEDVPREYRD